jgi:hypothetical protein
MKALCPICGIEGFLEQRGSNARIKHYQGFSGQQRIYSCHTVTMEQLNSSESIGNQLGINTNVGNQLGINTLDSRRKAASSAGVAEHGQRRRLQEPIL